nr:hypothetical protein [Tanacetum cinerariifolium]
MIDSLDKSNETIAKYLQEYQEFASELPLEKRIELISDLVKYQEHYTKVYKFQSQQRRPMTKKQNREYYMAVIKRNLGWRFKDFKGMTFKEIEAKFAEEPPEIKTSTEEFTEEKIKEMMLLVPVEDVYVQALQVKHPIIDWKFLHHLFNSSANSCSGISNLLAVGTTFTGSGNLYCQWELSPGSGISILLAVGTTFTGSGNLYCQWELSPGSGNALCILFLTSFS